MATSYGAGPGGRSWNSSPRPKIRENARNIPCRNIAIYGYCKHEKDGCMYNHDAARPKTNAGLAESFKKRLNADSPSFKPSVLEGSISAKNAGISPKAAHAAPFTPRSAKVDPSTSQNTSRNQSGEWTIPDFVPQSFSKSHQPQHDPNVSLNSEIFTAYDGSSGFSEVETPPNAHVNPYAADPTAGGAAFFTQQNAFAHPLQYHLYAPVGPHRENVPAYQRAPHDFFIAEDFRQDLQRKLDATLQTLHNSTLPNIEHFHSLVPLDVNTTKSTVSFGYNSWLYKAQSSKDGQYYALRRIEGFRVTSENGIRTIQSWKQIHNANCVTVHDCFTTRVFGDSSLIFVTDYCPLAKTLAETHLAVHSSQRGTQRVISPGVPEQMIWNYLVQLTSALRTIHSAGLSARLVNPTKILVTGRNRLKLNANAVLDVVQPLEDTPLSSLQQEDFRQVGRLAIVLASGNQNSAINNISSLEALSRSYSDHLRRTIAAFLDVGGSSTSSPSDASDFATILAEQAFIALDAALHADDALITELSREIENGRIVRLLSKLGFINERPEYSPHDPSNFAGISTQNMRWSETGDRYYLKLFRDYVFHQVSAEGGRPVIDLGHVITTLNKLDAGSEERIVLTTRDEQNVIIVSYREIKRGLEQSFNELRTLARGR